MIDSHCTELNNNWVLAQVNWQVPIRGRIPNRGSTSRRKWKLSQKIRIKMRRGLPYIFPKSCHRSPITNRKKIIKIWNGLRSTHKITTTITYVEGKNTKSICKLSGDLTFYVKMLGILNYLPFGNYLILEQSSVKLSLPRENSWFYRTCDLTENWFQFSEFF